MSVILVVVTDNGENFASLTYIITQHYTVYLCVLCGSENKQRLFPHSILAFINATECVYYCAAGTEFLQVNPQFP